MSWHVTAFQGVLFGGALTFASTQLARVLQSRSDRRDLSDTHKREDDLRRQTESREDDLRREAQRREDDRRFLLERKVLYAEWLELANSTYHDIGDIWGRMDAHVVVDPQQVGNLDGSIKELYRVQSRIDLLSPEAVRDAFSRFRHQVHVYSDALLSTGTDHDIGLATISHFMDLAEHACRTDIGVVDKRPPT